MSVFNGLRQGLADFPMMAEGVDNASQVPAISVSDGLHDFGSGGDGTVENRVGILHGHYHAHSAATKRVWAEVQVLGWIV